MLPCVIRKSCRSVVGGILSEAHVKRGVRIVHGDKYLEEKLGRNDPCPCGSGKCFQEVLHDQRLLSTAATEITMSADDWLKANDKTPYFPSDGLYENWYWMTYLYYHDQVLTEEEVEAEGDTQWTLPVPIWNQLQSKTTYPYVKMYDSRESALEDFRQAYDKAVAGGWKEI